MSNTNADDVFYRFIDVPAPSPEQTSTSSPEQRRIRMVRAALGNSVSLGGSDGLPVPAVVEMSDEEFLEFRTGLEDNAEHVRHILENRVRGDAQPA